MKEVLEFRVTDIDDLEKKGISLLPVQDINPEMLKTNPDNKIFKPLSESDYKRLKDDIQERGVIDPLIIRQDRVLLTGHNRLRIALELKLKSIPVRKVESGLKPKDERKFLVLDNLLRRQLTAEEKESLILEFYKEEILQDNRGGNRGNQFTKKESAKSEISLLPKSESLSKKIERETGIKEATVKKIVAKKRKELLPKIASKTEEISNELSLDDSKLRTLAIRKFDKKEKLSHPEKKILKTHFNEEIARKKKERTELTKDIEELTKKRNRIK